MFLCGSINGCRRLCRKLCQWIDCGELTWPNICKRKNQFVLVIPVLWGVRLTILPIVIRTFSTHECQLWHCQLEREMQEKRTQKEKLPNKLWRGLMRLRQSPTKELVDRFLNYIYQKNSHSQDTVDSYRRDLEQLMQRFLTSSRY